MRKKNATLPKAFSAVITVWGKDYIKRFLDFCLPSLLAEGNLPALNKVAPLTLHLYALSEEVESLFKPHPVWQQFTAQFNVLHEPLEMHKISDETSVADAHSTMIAVHNHFGKSVSADPDVLLIFLGPDALYSSNFFSFGLARIREGYRAVLYNALRVEREPVSSDLFNQLCVSNYTLNLSASKMLDIFRLHEHRVFKNRYLGEEKIASITSVFLWKDDAGNRVLRSIHWHPAMIWPEADFEWEKNHNTIDTIYTQSVLNAGSIYFQENMLDFVALDLSDEMTSEGNCVINGHPSINRYAEEISKLAPKLNVRVCGNILHCTLIPSTPELDLACQSVVDLVRRSLSDAQFIVTAIGSFNRDYGFNGIDLAETCSTTAIDSFNGIEPSRKGLRTRTDLNFTLGWVLLNPRKTIWVLYRYPSKVFRFVFKQPRDFFSRSSIFEFRPRVTKTTMDSSHT